MEKIPGFKISQDGVGGQKAGNSEFSLGIPVGFSQSQPSVLSDPVPNWEFPHGAIPGMWLVGSWNF